MSDHEFEKQVQARMDELKIRPTEAVWTKVEKRIRRERRRRRLILWAPVGLLLLVATGYLVLGTHSLPGQKNIAEQSTNPSNKNIPSTDNNSTLSNHSSENTGPVTTETNSGDHTGKKDDDQDLSPAPSATGDAVSGHLQRQGQNPIRATDEHILPLNKEQKHQRAFGKKGQRAGISRQGVSDNGEKRTFQQALSLGKDKKQQRIKDPLQDNQAMAVTTPPVEDQNNAITNDPDKRDTLTVDPQALTKDLAKQQPANTVNQSANTGPTAENAKLPPVNNRKKNSSNWQWGLMGNIGGSHIAKGSIFGSLFAILDNKNSVQEDLSAPSQSNAAVPTALPPANKPSSIKTGKAFSVGAFVQKPLSKRVSISAGLQYSYFSVHTKVGMFVEAPRIVNNAMSNGQMVRNYYQGPNVGATFLGIYERHDYTNRYHFIELPITLHTQLNKGKKLPIIWDAGISISQFLNSNALHYDGINDVYYKDFSFFNKTQVSIASAFNAALFANKAHPVWIGPRINYQLSNLLKKEVSEGQHLWSFGVNLKMFLKK